MQFSPVDYLVLFAYLIATTVLGLRIGHGSRNTKDYFLASQGLPWWALSLSIVATETSTLTFIGIPALAYDRNFTFLQLAFGYLLGKILVSCVLIPSYFRGDIQSVYEILNSRFGEKVKNFSAGLFQVNRTLADGVRLFATALVLSVVTQISDIWTVSIIGGLTIIYTFYGGFTAVVWNDVLQLFVYITGAIIAAFVLLGRIPGGWSEVVHLAEESNKFQITDFSFSLDNPYTFAAAVAGGAFLTFATHGTDQMMVQRYLACADRKKAQQGLILSGLIVILQFLLFLVIGILLFSFYQHNPHPDLPSDSQRLFPLFIVEELPRGISGLVIAAVFAAAMSTLSSSLNSLASSTLNDFYRPYFGPHASDKHYIRFSRIFTAGWGVVLISVSLLARNWGNVLEVGLGITSVVMGSVLGVFLLGKWTRVRSELAGLTAMMSGLGVVLLLNLNRAYDWRILPSLAWTWYVLISTVTTLVVGVLIERVWNATAASKMNS